MIHFFIFTKIIEIDTIPEYRQHKSVEIEISLESQDEKALLDSIKSNSPLVNIVLYNGSHITNRMKKLFAKHYDFVDANGAFIAEETPLSTGINLRKQLEKQPLAWTFQKPLLIT